MGRDHGALPASLLSAAGKSGELGFVGRWGRQLSSPYHMQAVGIGGGGRVAGQSAYFACALCAMEGELGCVHGGEEG